MSLSTETIQFNKKWNSVTNLLQPFITYSPYGLSVFSCPLPLPRALCGQKRNTEAMTREYRWPAMKSLSQKVFAASTLGCCPCSPRCAEVWPWAGRCGTVPFPFFARRSSSICCACSWVQHRSGFCPPYLHIGTWICELRGGTDWSECVWQQLPNEICSHSKAILCGEVPPVVFGGCFPNHSSATMAPATFFCCGWKVFKASRPTEGNNSWLWLSTCVCQLTLEGSPMVLKDLEPFCQQDVSSVIS